MRELWMRCSECGMMDKLSKELIDHMGQASIDAWKQDLKGSDMMAICYECCDETVQKYVEAPPQYLIIEDDDGA
jgi:hypothetical protein